MKHCMWQKLVWYTNIISGLLKIKRHCCLLYSCGDLTYSGRGVHAFQQEAPCILGFTETSLIRNRALSGMLCLNWVICKSSVPAQSTVRTKSMCRLSEGPISILCFSNYLEIKQNKYFQMNIVDGRKDLFFSYCLISLEAHSYSCS